MKKETILEIEGLSKRYASKRGVDQITLTINKGDIYGFFGPNGAGKTTVMKIVSGLCRADRGRIRLFGIDAQEEHEAAMRRVGVLIEKAEAYEYMSAYKNLSLAARLYPELPKSRIDEVLELVGLGANKHEKVGRYSLGMKQRLGIASAMLSKPELLILDEPTNGLDIEGMVAMRELIVRLAREEGTTFFLSSHLIAEMERICNRIGIMHQGRLIREFSMHELREAGESLESFYVTQLRMERGGEPYEAAAIGYH
jgi:ABC-2 type transport system ATP-binding protein